MSERLAILRCPFSSEAHIRLLPCELLHNGKFLLAFLGDNCATCRHVGFKTKEQQVLVENEPLCVGLRFTLSLADCVRSDMSQAL